METDEAAVFVERRAHARKPTQAHCMVKVGLQDAFYGYGTIRQISPGNVLVETDVFKDIPFGKGYLLAPGKDLILVGMEKWNRHFSILGRIARITYDQAHIACSICTTTSDAFLGAWIAKGL